MDLKYRDVLFQPIKYPVAWQPRYGSLVGLLDVDELLLSLPSDDFYDLQLNEDHLKQEWFKKLVAASASAPLGEEMIELMSKFNKWTAMSLMQKGVRRSLWQHTFLAVCALFTVKAATDCKRRLQVIALEDVGNGDPEAAALAFLLLDSKIIKEKFGLQTQCLMAARVLTKAWKSRDLCDLAAITYMPENKKLLKAFAGDTVEVRVKRACDKELSMVTRLAAFGSLWKDKQLETTEDCFDARVECYGDALMSPSWAYASEICYKRIGATFGINSIAAALLTQEPTAGEDVFPVDNRVHNGLLVATLDRHTSQGKSAIKRLSFRQPFRDWFINHPWNDRYDTILRLAFYSEASLLKPRVMYPRALDLYWQVLDLKFRQTGMKDFLTEAPELFEMMLASFEKLDEMRLS